MELRELALAEGVEHLGEQAVGRVRVGDDDGFRRAGILARRDANLAVAFAPALERVRERHDVEVVRTRALEFTFEAVSRVGRNRGDVFEMRTATPSWEASVVRTDFGIARSWLCGIDAELWLMLLSKKTRMIVIMSSIAVMLRKSMSGSLCFFRICFRSSRLYAAMLAGFCGPRGAAAPGGGPPGGGAPGGGPCGGGCCGG